MICEISLLFGLKVYTDEGRYVGKVYDVVIDLEGKQIKGLALGEYNRSLINSKSPGIILPYRLVKAVGDIIIVRDIFKFKSKKLKEKESSKQ